MHLTTDALDLLIKVGWNSYLTPKALFKAGFINHNHIFQSTSIKQNFNVLVNKRLTILNYCVYCGNSRTEIYAFNISSCIRFNNYINCILI
ncbi:hypothetical protein MtrunA17_Chr3g0118591 [Medicago truncatula]|uniref:Uncharacterized protein n=1 Tax=Medicago truncatula TaxID=3880 RepID=A0A396IXT1_MEDTR|nr:hypothetical protein MtrunA17_Chr3g0118591 [Medicago truncatula]